MFAFWLKRCPKVVIMHVSIIFSFDYFISLQVMDDTCCQQVLEILTHVIKLVKLIPRLNWHLHREHSGQKIKVLELHTVMWYT